MDIIYIKSNVIYFVQMGIIKILLKIQEYVAIAYLLVMNVVHQVNVLIVKIYIISIKVNVFNNV